MILGRTYDSLHGCNRAMSGGSTGRDDLRRVTSAELGIHMMNRLSCKVRKRAKASASHQSRYQATGILRCISTEMGHGLTQFRSPWAPAIKCWKSDNLASTVKVPMSQGIPLWWYQKHSRTR